MRTMLYELGSLTIYHSMSEILLALVAGVLVGAIFSAVKLPLPAPPVLSGIIGIVGIYLGGHLYQWILKSFFS